MTNPANDLAARLPGSTPWSVHHGYDFEYIEDADGQPLDLEKAVAWINSTAAQLAAKDAEIASLKMQIKGHGATISRQSRAHGKTIRELAAATLRIASAEKVISNLVETFSDELDTDQHADIDAARSWRDASKDGETHED